MQFHFAQSARSQCHWLSRLISSITRVVYIERGEELNTISMFVVSLQHNNASCTESYFFLSIDWLHAILTRSILCFCRSRPSSCRRNEVVRDCLAKRNASQSMSSSLLLLPPNAIVIIIKFSIMNQFASAIITTTAALPLLSLSLPLCTQWPSKKTEVKTANG